MISIYGYCATTAELGCFTAKGKWIPNGAVEHLAKQVESLRARVAEQTESIRALTEQNAALIWERDGHGKSNVPDIFVQNAALVGENMLLKSRINELEQEKSAAINSMNDALTESEAQARLLGMGSEREARLMARVMELEKDAARYRWLRNENAYFPEEEMIRGEMNWTPPSTLQ